MSAHVQPSTGAPEAPLISIVVAVLNGATTIQRCFDSVFEQTFDRCELIVIDGGSTDGTRDIVARNAGRIAYWVSEKDRGIYSAWNKALPHTRGSWILFLGADDRIHDPSVLESLAGRLIGAGRDVRVAYGLVNRVDDKGMVLSSHGAPWSLLRGRFREGMALPHQGVLHHRNLFARNGAFDESFRIAGDYEFLLRELLDHEPLFLPDVVVDMGAGGISDRPEHWATLVRESHRARRAHHLASRSQGIWLSLSLIRAGARVSLTRRFGASFAGLIAQAYRFVVRSPKTHDQ